MIFKIKYKEILFIRFFRINYSLILAIIALVGCRGWAQREKAQKLPNIVFYISDDLSASDISIYKNQGIEVPNITRLAESGLKFNRAFIASPSCAPSRAALLTGLYPNNNGALANHTYPRTDLQRLPQILKKLGYEVVAFGKIDHNITEERAEQNGFDFYSKKMTQLPQQVREYFKNKVSDKPVCLLVGDRRPHVQWIEDANYPMNEVRLPDFFLDTQETREHWARYATDVQGMDHDMGEIMRMAKENLGENSIFLFSADHGSQWPFGKWNLYDYGIRVPLIVSWQGNISAGSNTDALVSWIDIFPTLIDIAGGKVPNDIDGKSFLSVLKNPHTGFRDYIFTEHSGDGDFNVYPIRSVRTERFKYIENLFPENYHTNHSDVLRKDGAGGYWDSWEVLAQNDSTAFMQVQKYFIRPEAEFYDLKNDPLEQVNLIYDRNYIKEINRLKSILHQEYKTQNDKLELIGEPWPVSGNRPNKESIDARRKN